LRKEYVNHLVIWDVNDGLSAVTALGTVRWVDGVRAEESDIKQWFAKVFKELRTGESHCAVGPAVSYLLYASRNAPIPPRDEDKEELNATGVIIKVNE